MERFQLSRKEMADFLLAINTEGDQAPKAILQKAWETTTHKQIEKEGTSLIAISETEVPLIFVKILKSEKNPLGFSLNEVVQLGNQIEFSYLSSTAVQNWVKRDVKELIGSPQFGKKYTVDQVATLFIVEDLKACLDFDSIRKILRLIFNNPADRSDDVIRPVQFYRLYAAIFERFQHVQFDFKDHTLLAKLESSIQTEVREQVKELKEVKEEKKDLVTNVLLTTTFTVYAAYFQTLTQRYVTATLLS